MNYGKLRLMDLILVLLVSSSEVAFSATNTVDVNSNFFSPTKLTNHVGDTIIFRRVSGSHTVTGQAPEAFCGPNAMPATCSVTLMNAGTFPYRCVFHSSSFTSGVPSMFYSWGPP